MKIRYRIIKNVDRDNIFYTIKFKPCGIRGIFYGWNFINYMLGGYVINGAPVVLYSIKDAEDCINNFAGGTNSNKEVEEIVKEIIK